MGGSGRFGRMQPPERSGEQGRATCGSRHPSHHEASSVTRQGDDRGGELGSDGKGEPATREEASSAAREEASSAASGERGRVAAAGERGLALLLFEPASSSSRGARRITRGRGSLHASPTFS
uniref:Uncharacterized protein n=1 Tax=Oryza sativa subsp. japonica TaxID=39947 RepID=Q8W5G5_ORYSJ|nr:hypothetical protein [Oryza sativa Japonica Group]